MPESPLPPMRPPPLRGIGSGILGSDPDAPAPAGPDFGSARAAQMKERADTIARMRSELQAAHMSGQYINAGVAQDVAAAAEFFKALPDSVVAQQYEELLSVGDSGESKSGKNFADPQPGDPDYNPYFDTKRRARIEAQLPQMDLADLLFSQRISQSVPLENGLVLDFVSITGAHPTFLSRLATKRLAQESQATYDTTTSLWRLALLLTSYSYSGAGKNNRVRLPADEIYKLTDLADPSAFKAWEAALDQRVAELSRLPAALLAEFSLQSYWFELRINDLVARGNLSDRVGKS